MKKLSEIETGLIADVAEVSVGVLGRPFVPHLTGCRWARGPAVRLDDNTPTAVCPECGAVAPLNQGRSEE
jgi:hypothetical protein